MAVKPKTQPQPQTATAAANSTDPQDTIVPTTTGAVSAATPASTAASTITAVNDEVGTTDAPTAAKGKRSGAPAGPRGPQLVWNDERNAALIEVAVKDGVLDPTQLAARLADHDAFDGETAPITASKVRLHYNDLRKNLLPELPELRRGAGKGYKPDVSRLRQILAEAQAGQAIQAGQVAPASAAA